MKRSRPTETGIHQSWTAGGRRHTITKTAYRQDITTAAPRPHFERKDFLEGIIDKALSAQTLSSSPIGSGRNIKPLPPGLAPLPSPKGPNVGVGILDNGGELMHRISESRQPIVASHHHHYNSFDEFSTSAMSQQSSHLSSDRESFDRVKAEIDEILSPVSECGDRGNSGFPPSLNYPVLQIPPLSTGPAAARPSQMNPEPSRTNGRGSAMQDLLRAMASPSKRGANGRRLMPAGSTQCHLCGKTYTESSNLSKHIRTVHLKLRPFRCHLCTSRFAEKNKLGKHIQSVHEHARPYKCDLCSASFSQASDRKRHRLVLHEGRRPFVCEHCGKAFGRRSSLTQHCQRVHKMNLKPTPAKPPVALQPPVGMPSPTIAPPALTPPALMVPPQLSLTHPSN